MRERGRAPRERTAFQSREYAVFEHKHQNDKHHDPGQGLGDIELLKPEEEHVAGSSLSPRLYPFVAPSMLIPRDGKAQRLPDLLQRVRLHSLMKSGRFGISMRTWPQRHESLSISVSYQESCRAGSRGLVPTTLAVLPRPRPVPSVRF